MAQRQHFNALTPPLDVINRIYASSRVDAVNDI